MKGKGEIMSPKLSSEALHRRLRQLPPSQHDELTVSEIERFGKIGGVGWKYIGNKLCSYRNLTQKLEQI